MKIKVTIIALLLLFTTNLHAQNNISAIVEYKIYSAIDLDRDYKDFGFHTDTVGSTLKFNKNYSVFKVQSANSRAEKRNINRIFAGGDDKFYYNLNENEFIMHSSKLSKNYNVVLDTINWSISEETRIINKLLCYKATRKEQDVNGDGLVEKPEIIAWFAPEIPFKFGPSKYRGLPGLIIECQYGNTIFKLSEIQWIEKDIEIDIPKNSDKITFKKFKEIAKENLPDFFDSSNSKIGIDWFDFK